MLDLGAWMAVQSEVENVHRLKVMQNEVLANSTFRAFNNLSAGTLNNIFKRWKK